MSSSDSNTLDPSPAVAPPSGVTSNFVDPPSKGPEIERLGGIFTGLMALSVVIRLVVRTRFTKQWGWDDLACCLAALGSLANLIVIIQCIRLVGFGRHMWNIPASWVLETSNIQLLSSTGIIYLFTILFTKLSILFLYLRIFSISNVFRYTIYSGVAIMALFYTAMICAGIGALVLCKDETSSTLQLCKDYSGPVVMLNVVFNVVTDFWVLIMPYPLLSKLQMRFRQHVGLTFVFAAGLAACAASMARLIVFAINYTCPDVLWVSAITSEFTMVEMNVGICVACVSTFPIFFAKLKAYIQSATDSLRTLLTSSPGKGSTQRTSTLSRKSQFQTHETGQTLVDHGNRFIELPEVAPSSDWASDRRTNISHA